MDRPLRFVRTIAVTLLLSALAIRAATQDVGHTMARPVDVDHADWTNLAGRVGPYGGITSADDARRMLADGLTLAVISAPSQDVRTLLRNGGARYIDAHLWRFVYQICSRQTDAQGAAGQPLACTISPKDEDLIAAQASTYLSTIELDPALAGYWILDDYPHGDVTSVLLRLHGLVQQSNIRTGFQRPTVCGVGGTLDFKRTVDEPVFIQNHSYLDQALRNVFPAACDVVSPYFYASATADDPLLVDWSMHELLPYFQQALSARGFDSLSAVVVPIAHVFSAHPAGRASYYVMPRPDDVATQMQAYCESGARSVLFFTWQSADADRSYVSEASLREGVEQGLVACTRLWHSREKAR